MRLVAKLAGVSRQAVYLHFENKAELLLATAKHLDDRLGREARLAPLDEARDAETLLERYASFLADYNPLLYPIFRAADAVRSVDADVAEAWKVRLANRQRGSRRVVQALRKWGRLSPDWTLQTATDWLTVQSSVKVWEELVNDLGWSRKRYVATMQLAMRRALLKA